MGGKSKSKSTSTTGSAQTWAQPLATAAANDVQSVYSANQPALQQLTDLTHNSVVNPLTAKFNASLGTSGLANNYYSDVLNGKYLGGNPYIGKLLDQSRRDVANDVNSQFELNGRYGSDAHGYGLARGMADAENNLLYQNYSDEMNRMGAAAGSANAANAGDVAALVSALGLNAQLPYTGSSNLANSLGALFNGGTATSTQTGPNPLWGALGAGLGALGSVFQGKG